MPQPDASLVDPVLLGYFRAEGLAELMERYRGFQLGTLDQTLDDSNQVMVRFVLSVREDQVIAGRVVSFAPGLQTFEQAGLESDVLFTGFVVFRGPVVFRLSANVDRAVLPSNVAILDVCLYRAKT